MAISRTPHVDNAIWKLKRKQKPEPEKDNSVPPNLMDAPLYQRNLKDEEAVKFAKNNALIDELVEATQYMQELFQKEIKSGNIPSSMSYSEWLESLRLKRLNVSDGGPIDPADDLLKQWLKLMELRSRLSERERDNVDFLIDKLAPKNKPSQD